MCGIAGLIGDLQPEIAGAAVKRMISSLARRGPDSEGIESWPGAVLGHRRLAIFDLTEAGRQPMLSADGNVGVVFNGSVYNFRELREELIALGRRFNSDTDTEVLIYGYIEWGMDELLRRLRGMFAFGLWDAIRQKVILVRDRLGVKPLCYSIQGNTIAFASTPRALRCAGFADQLDSEAVLTYLSLGFIPDQLCVYASVKKVPAATVIEWENGNLSERQYWHVPTPHNRVQVSFQEAVEETERLFVDAVRSRLYAHVPLGALLSGGVDSALVCWAISQLGGNVTAYTMGVPGDPWDESNSARESAKILGLNHEVLQISEHGEGEAEKLVQAYAEPFAAASALGMLRISEAAAGAVTVLLTGDGGDDVFLGYPRHRYLWMAGKTPIWARPGLRNSWGHLKKGFPRRGPLRRMASFVDYAAGDLDAFFDDFFWLRNPNFMPLLGERLNGQNLMARQRSSAPQKGEDILGALLSHEYKSRFVGEYLTKVDGATMYHALEARSPFLDQELWEFAASLPYDLRLRGGKLKAILRAIVLRRLGPATARRRKSGFGIPVHRWILGRWRLQVQAAFQDSVLEEEGWIDAGYALKLLESPGAQEYLEFVWRLYILELWMRKERGY